MDMKYSFFRKKRSMTNQRNAGRQSSQTSFDGNLAGKLAQNLNAIKDMYDNPSDLVVREMELKNLKGKCALVYIDGLADKNLVNEQIIRNILLFADENVHDPVSITDLSLKLLSVSAVTEVSSFDEVSLAILSGDAALFLDNFDNALIIGSKGYETRSLEEPITEGVIRGPRIGFVENIRTNTALVRRDIRDQNLRMKAYKVGRRSKTDAVVLYVDGIVHPDIVKEVERRLKSIDIDDVLESSYIEEFIEDSTLSPFPQIQNTERPDKVSAALLEGRVAILLDGTPFALIVPSVFMHFLQSPEDYFAMDSSFVFTILKVFDCFYRLICSRALYSSCFFSTRNDSLEACLFHCRNAGRSPLSSSH